MPFKSKSQNIRLCKHCDMPAKKNIINGVNKGYFITCGSKQCLNANFRDKQVVANRCTIKNIKMVSCVVCGELFNKRAGNNGSYCKECVPSPKWQRVAKLYGIGKGGFDILFEKQNGKCALCDKAAACIDHDHKTNKVRGLLCHGCNHLIIAIERGEDWITKAKEYLTNQHDFLTLISYKNAV